MKICEKIKELRKENELTQKEFAEKIGVSRMSVQFWEEDRVDPSLFNAIVMSDFFGISLDELCGREKK